MQFKEETVQGNYFTGHWILPNAYCWLLVYPLLLLTVYRWQKPKSKQIAEKPISEQALLLLTENLDAIHTIWGLFCICIDVCSPQYLKQKFYFGQEEENLMNKHCSQFLKEHMGRSQILSEHEKYVQSLSVILCL